MKKALLLMSLIIVFCGILVADISDYYEFVAGTTTYTEITGTPQLTAQGDDVITAGIDLGFTFPYGDNAYTQIRISSNGAVALGTTPSPSLSNSLVSTTICPVVAPLWDDLHTGRVQDATYPQTSSVQTLMQGTAPNRSFTIQYKNAYWYYSVSTSWVNFQVVLYENGNVEFIYGPNAGTGPGASASASIGINMLPGGATNYWSVSPLAGTASNTVENAAVNAYIPNGTKFSFNVPLAVANDMAALSIVGNTTPTAGTASVYTVTVRNRGSAAQSNYQVKLMTGTTELASVAGPAIQPGVITPVQVSWTPSTPGPLTIYGKVVLTGDQNPTNDQTASMNVVVQAEGTIVVTVGDGSQTARIPVDMYYRNSLFETIYQASEITAGGMLMSITFFNQFVTNLPNMPTKIWLGITGQNDLSAGWIPSTALSLVFDGTVDYSAGQNEVLIPLQTPYPYAGGNLVMMVNRPMDATYYSTSDVFKSQTVGSNRSRNVFGDATTYDPANPGNVGTVSGQFPKTAFHFIATGNQPQFVISPESYNFGSKLINSVNNFNFNIMNIGGGTTPLVINNITISGSPFFTLQNLPTLPASLTSGQMATFTLRYTPTAAGTHTATITITDNLTRTQHQVQVSGSCFDPTIYTSPYVQNWDAVTVPNLPQDWFKISTGAGNATTTTSSPHSAPNCVYLYNSSDTSGPFLIAPPLAATLPVNTMRVRFWAKGATNYSLSVGVMSNHTDAGTYTQVQSFNLTSAWAEYVVGFQTYAGTGNFITFKHGNAATYQSIYIDGVSIEVIAQNDLAALSVTGNTTPSVGMATTYTVNLFNWGTNPQSNYSVKLFREGDIEVASIAGPTIQPGMAGQAQLVWTPATQGQTYIYGKVVLTGDQNAVNDQSPNLNVSVQAAGTMVVTVGDGSQTSYQMPVNMFYKASLYENIYLQTELNFIGMITGISFYNNFLTNLPNKPTKVWLGTTTQTNLADSWINSTNLTLVFDGTVNYPSGQNTITITFPQPYLYLENNLVMLVERPMDTQYFSTSDLFYTQTVGTNRARYIFSDTVVYDPTNITGGTVTGMFPKTSMFVIPGGVGHLTGTVLGAGNVPLANATVQIINGGMATTNAQGQYTIQNIIAGTYQVTCSRYGYVSQTVNVTIPEDETITQNFTLLQMPTVNVTGTIVGSDNPTVGIAGAIIQLTGYENYSATANAQGQFTIPGVYTSQTYQYIASAVGYQVATGTINVGTTDYSMGTVTVNEIAYTPRNVQATQATNQQSVTVNWLAPDPNAVDITQSFENAAFPPTDWTRIITNNGPANASGVFPTWCRVGTVTAGTDTVVPSNGAWQAGFWWDYNHQDEWLITPQFNCPQGATLSFGSYYFRGSTNGDHYYVKITTNNGNTWDVLWDASTLTGGWSNYVAPVVIDLAAYAGQQVKLAWHAQDPPTNDGMWYVWFIDEVVIGNTAATIRFPESAMRVQSATRGEEPFRSIASALPVSRDGNRGTASVLQNSSDRPATGSNVRNRALIGYKVWRLVQGQEQNEQTWTLLTPETITELSQIDNGWAAVTPGTYKWAVKGVYTGNVLSLGAFSNAVVKQSLPQGTLLGVVRNSSNVPISGAVITAGSFTATTSASGAYTMPVNVGTYNVVCTATGYNSQTNANVNITEGQSTISNFTLTPVSNEHEVEITRTALKGNYPNPFNPETIISFDIKTRTSVRIEIYNMKGQLIRTLVNDMVDKGHHQLVWNGRDNNGNSVASGVYQYRMQAGEYKATRRMMLMK